MTENSLANERSRRRIALSKLATTLAKYLLTYHAASVGFQSAHRPLLRPHISHRCSFVNTHQFEEKFHLGSDIFQNDYVPRSASAQLLARAKASSFPLSALRPLVQSLRENQNIHRRELRECSDLGYARGTSVLPYLPHAFGETVPRRALGLGPKNPFASDELVFFTQDPILSRSSCMAIRNEAAANIEHGAGSTFTMIDTNRDVNVHSLPISRRLLNRALRSTLYPLAFQLYPEAVVHPDNLFVYRALVVQYEAAAGLTHQPIHRDGSLITAIISLSSPQEYHGGGTWIEALGRSIAPSQGNLLMHPSALRHSGRHISSGERWVLVVFIGHESMPFAEHGRRFKARAAMAAEKGDVTGELKLLQQGIQVCPDFPELWGDRGGSLHERGDIESALKHYETALELNPADAQLHSNRGVAFLESNAPPEIALQSFEYALSLNSYLIPAWRNLCGALCALGRAQDALDILMEAPPSVQADPLLANLSDAVGSTASYELTLHLCRANRGFRRD